MMKNFYTTTHQLIVTNSPFSQEQYVPEWNILPAKIVQCKSLDIFFALIYYCIIVCCTSALMPLASFADHNYNNNNNHCALHMLQYLCCCLVLIPTHRGDAWGCPDHPRAYTYTLISPTAPRSVVSCY